MGKYFYLLLTFFWIFTDIVFAQQKQTPNQYIEKYKDYAIIEMHRASVPASITLAQGILESSSGNSRLAKYGNNHFGIKCKSTWTGAVMYANDDAPNECFRAYENALESFKDHSDFLRNNWRYHQLFDLDITNYKGWANGLRKAGYATNRKYDVIIINLIEKYKLYQYDLVPEPEYKKPFQVSDNEIPIIYAKEGDDANSIARENDMTEKQVRKYNDLPPGKEFDKGDIVYLKPKRRRGSQKYHVVKTGDNMYQISQQYGIKLKHLYRRNRLEKGVEPLVGEKLYMKGKIPRKEHIKAISEEEFKAKQEKEKNTFINPHSIQKAAPIVREKIEIPEYHILQKGENIYRIAEKYHILEEDLLKWNNISAVQLVLGQKIYLSKKSADKAVNKQDAKTTIKPKNPKEKNNIGVKKYYTVKKGDTLYSICKKHGISSSKLQEMNNLKGNTVFIGQKIKVAN